MKNKKLKDKKKRQLSLHKENQIFTLKSIYKNSTVLKLVQWNSSLKLNKLLKDTSLKNRLVNRCILTGRKKKINKKFRFSRLAFLTLARNGFISGLFKK